MDLSTAKARAAVAWEVLNSNSKVAKQMKRREDYLHGDQDKPWAPEGIGDEHESLRGQSQANWMPLPVYAPIQRMRCEGLRSGVGDEFDKGMWRDIWAANRLEARQTIIYESMMTHGRGIASVWPNLKNHQRPIVRPQSVRNVYIHPSEDDPFTAEYAVKIVERQQTPNSLVVPTGARESEWVAYVYDDNSWYRLVRETTGWAEGGKEGSHQMRAVPFVTFDYRPNANGEIFSPVDPLIPQQNAINTIRFNMLLAMQFSAFRQRVVTGFDPVMRDEAGQIVYKKDESGAYVTENGRRVPLLNDFGRAAVDRMLVFNGNDTKVFDMPESNLKNYVEMLTEFLTQFFATSQVPPQYLLSRMANLSGDAISGAESTLTSLQGELKRYANEGMVELFSLAARASGREEPNPDMEMLYADTEVKSFAQIVDGIQKLITSGFPREAAWEMLPGANQPKVARWLTMADDELDKEFDRLVKGDMNAPDSRDTALQLAAEDRRGRDSVD
ncbi:phage portal protein [Microbacterium paludicola]|uniref:phage portal protein n=1 Tax=Microbacterium paludicola TaxID=300019 RepID=UPI0011A84158|nr:phage portal protein [Microbacterium paludicola]